MEKSAVILIVILLLSTIAYPALAFQADNLTISLDPEGNANVAFTYHLSWLEYFAVFMRIVDPALEVQKFLEENLDRTVIVQSAGTDSTRLTVESFAAVERSGGATTLTTPGMSFAGAQRVLESYWFSPLINPDFTPAITKVRFPDGYEETFSNVASIPSLTHTYSS
jgi:hypothetical protein